MPPLIIRNRMHEFLSLHIDLPIPVLLQLLHLFQHSHLLHHAENWLLLVRAPRGKQDLSRQLSHPHQYAPH